MVFFGGTSEYKGHRVWMVHYASLVFTCVESVGYFHFLDPQHAQGNLERVLCLEESLVLL